MPAPRRFLVAGCLAVLIGTSGVRPVCAAEGVRDVLDRIGVTRGICVVLGDPTGERRISGLEPIWEYDAPDSVALALGKNALVVASGSEVVAVGLADGKTLWKQPLPCVPVSWGLAVDRQGRILLALEDGSVLCLAQDTRG